MQIVICDDDKRLQEIMTKEIDRICEENGMTCEIRGCSSGEALLCIGEAPDILFLDIEMPGQDGMTAAEALRMRRWDTVLIFVTAWPEYVYEAFDVGAFHYLVKPFEMEKLRAVFLKALEQCRRQELSGGMRAAEGEMTADRKNSKVILVKRGGISTTVPVGNIIYAEVFNRKITLHTTDEDVEYYGKLTELSEQVGEGFYRTHRAYLVNLRYVEKYDSSTIWLERGTALVAKKQFAGFVKAYMRYISGKGRQNG